MSLRRRTTLIGVLVVAVVLAGVGAALHVSTSNDVRDGTEAVLHERLDIAAALSQRLPAGELAAELRSLGIPATVTRPDGSMVRGEPPSAAVGAGLPALAGIDGPRLTGEVRHPDGSLIRISVSRVGAVEVLDQLRQTLLISTVLGVAVAAVLLWRGTTLALRPLDAVVQAARRIAGGERSVRVRPARTDTEIGEVGTALDGVVDALEAALEDARRHADANERFVADAAHQLRTPLTGIRAAAEALVLGLDAAGQERATTIIVSQTERASALVGRLLRLAELDMGELPPAELVDLAAVCAVEVERARQLAPEVEVVLHDRTRGAAPIELDPASMREALANLLDNACRHARSAVTVELVADEADIAIRVVDDGDGVRAGDAEAVFQRFVSLDDHGGSGLGLPIARAIVDSHGGTLRYEDGAFVIHLGRERRARPRISGAV